MVGHIEPVPLSASLVSDQTHAPPSAGLSNVTCRFDHDGAFSGSASMGPDGQPRLLYTGVSQHAEDGYYYQVSPNASAKIFVPRKSCQIRGLRRMSRSARDVQLELLKEGIVCPDGTG